MFGLKLLTTEQVNKIYEGALKILERTGVKFADRKIIDSFAERGAKVDFERNRVHLPSFLIEEILKEVDPAFNLYSRDLKRHLRIGKPEVHFSNSTYDVYVLDYQTGQRHKSKIEDVEKIIRLNDGLDNIDVVGAQIVPHDVPPPLQQIKAAEMLLNNTTKPFMINLLNAEECKTLLEMVIAVAGSESNLRERPFLVVPICPDSPLRYEKPVTDIMQLSAKHGIPVGIGACPILGMSSPTTLAGALTQALAEAIAGITFVKLVSDECPVYLGITPFVMAPQGNLLMATPECYLICWGYAQICQHLKIPNSFSCTHTDSKVPTIQSGYEKGMGLMQGVFSGSPLVQVPAILDDGATTSLEQLVIESEAVGAAKRLLKGISVSDETLALDVINECAVSESFIAHDHTVAYLRSEFWSPKVFFRGTWEQFEAERKTVVDNAISRVKEILTDHCPTPLPAEVKREVEKIVARAGK